MKAIIGGTGVYDISNDMRREKVETDFGSVLIDIINVGGEDIAFLARHGKNHSVPPHLINYRANTAALEKIGVNEIFATCAVGSMNEAYEPGSVVLLKDFIDLTKGRDKTMFIDCDAVRHVDMSDPYCRRLRDDFKAYALSNALDLKGEAVYICTEGPRFETASEIRSYRSMGADVVGMTNVPEVVFMKEYGICYCAVGIITNWCTGFNAQNIMLHDINASIQKNKDMLAKAFIDIMTSKRHGECRCKDALIEL